MVLECPFISRKISRYFSYKIAEFSKTTFCVLKARKLTNILHLLGVGTPWPITTQTYIYVKSVV